MRVLDFYVQKSREPSIFKLQPGLHQGSVLQRQASEVVGVEHWYSLNLFYCWWFYLRLPEGLHLWVNVLGIALTSLILRC